MICKGECVLSYQASLLGEMIQYPLVVALWLGLRVYTSCMSGSHFLVYVAHRMDAKPCSVHGQEFCRPWPLMCSVYAFDLDVPRGWFENPSGKKAV